MRLVMAAGAGWEMGGVEVVVLGVGGTMFQYVAAPFHSQRVRLADLDRCVEGEREEDGR